MIHILNYDEDVFVLLVFWVSMQKIVAQVQVEKWNRIIIHINNTAAALGNKNLQLLGMHAVTGCDTEP